ncbi:zinc finger protein 76 [Caerostris extrusa]|uniref:Zinc finger protein 76 n=1 Tax=Caerostris extrusa TaxID=172846 RepID=A0AAV4PYD3_CAEEX|nr:zinc finger protein 76 [Caerostris extrusa]
MVSTEIKQEELECQKAQEVIGMLLQKPEENNDEPMENSTFSICKRMSDLPVTAVTVSVADSPSFNICQVSLEEAGMILESSDVLHHTLSSASPVELEDGTTTFVQSFEAVDESDSGDIAPKFVDGQAVQLEDGTTAFIHAAPREGLQPVQLEDGTLAYLSQAGSELFNGEESVLGLEHIADNHQVTENEGKDPEVKVKENNNRAKRTVEKAFRCHYPDCDRLYTTWHHLRVHERTHTGDRPFKCTAEGCGKAFATGYGLKSHTRVHTGETPYKCPNETCFKAFKTSGDLQKHVRTHTGERPFKCPFNGCNRAFTTSNIRKVHLRTHTGERPYICKEEGCGRAFASATNYKNHIRIHTGEKPYACSVSGCNKRFTEYSSLYKHHVVHTHFKPYACSLCGKNYRQTSTLAMHKRTAHGIMDINDSEKKRRPMSECEQQIDDPTEVDAEEMSPDDEANTTTSPKIISLQQSSVGVSDAKTFPTIVTLQSDTANQILQEHPIYAVQLQEDGTLSSTMQQVVLVTDSSQLAALQSLAQQNQFETISDVTCTQNSSSPRQVQKSNRRLHSKSTN